MLTTLGIVLPVFGLILTGYVVGRTPLIGEAGKRGLTNFVFYIAMPAFLFRATATLDWPSDADLSIIAAYFGSCFAIFALGASLGRRLFGHDLGLQAMLGMSVTFSNSVLIGIPLVLAAFGERALLPAMLIIGVHPLILMTVPTILIESHRGGGGAWHAVARSTVASLLKNPIILGMGGGLIYGQLGLGLPDMVDRFVELLGRAGPPTALFAVGAGLTGYRIGGDLREVSLAVVIKLLALPALVWLTSRYLFGLDPLWVATATVIAATPIGVNVFVFANTYQIYIARAAASVLLSTALAWLTTSLLLAVLVGSMP